MYNKTTNYKSLIVLLIFSIIFGSCSKEESSNRIQLDGKIKSIMEFDSARGYSTAKYEFFYSGSNGNLYKITKDNSEYIYINSVEEGSIYLFKNNEEESKTEKYVIKYDLNRNVKSMSMIEDSIYIDSVLLDTVIIADKFLFSYTNQQIDTIMEAGEWFVGPSLISNYDFNIDNNNCNYYTCTYLSGYPFFSFVKEYRTLNYNSLLNNKYIPFQDVLEIPIIWNISPEEGILSMPYIANLFDLKVGLKNKNLISDRFDIMHYDYQLNDRNQVIKINWFSTENRTLLNKLFTFEYY